MAGIHQATLSRIEAGVSAASKEHIHALSRSLQYPEGFFFAGEQVEGPGIPEFYHARRRKAIPTRVLEKAYACVTIRRIHIERLLRASPVDYDHFPLMPSSEWGDPAKVARTVRAQMGLPSGPVANLTEIVENSGGVVVSCNFESSQMDGFSRWRSASQPPLFFMNTNMAPDRWRWTLAHELGHVVLHTNEHPSGRIEDEANMFAQEFLMPEQPIKSHLANLTFGKLSGLKVYWKVSMQALVYRAFSLEQISDRQRRYFYAQLTRAGYRKREPPELDPPVESPKRLGDKIVFHRRNLGFSVEELAAMLSLNEDELKELYDVESRKGFRLVE